MNTLVLTITSKFTFKLNHIELSQEDFCLLLECIGYDVPENLTLIEVFHLSLCSLPSLDEREFYHIFNKFLASTPEDRLEMKQIIAKRKHFAEYSSPN